MEIITVPEATALQKKIVAGDISFLDYRDKGGLFRNRVMFNCYAFSFVQHGQKQIYRATQSTVLKPGHGMLIPEGNSIIAEHSDTAEPYNSIIIFFPGHIGRSFIATHPKQQTRHPHTHSSYIHFAANTYINEYLANIKRLIATGENLSEELAILKVNELLIALYELSPALLTDVFSPAENMPLKSLVENNLFNKLSLDELAFLANRSLSSFKRDFEKTYGLSPQKYIRERKLELASAELVKGRLPSELYLEYGYENLSNFNTAFKRKYGITPAVYRQSA